MKDESFYELAIIGSGASGVEAALLGALRGARVLLIENHLLGGGAVHAGTIPMRSLLQSARTARELQRQGDGEDAARLSDWVTSQRRTVARTTERLAHELADAKVTILRGAARLLGEARIHVTENLPTGPVERTVRAGQIILATGAKPDESEQVWPESAVGSSRRFMSLAEAPDRLVIIGGGHIGCEFACVYHTLGAQVTIIEKGDRLLPEMDREAGEFLREEFAARGILVRFGETARAIWGVTSGEFGVAGVLPDGEEFFADKVLLATGRVPNIHGLGLDEAGVRFHAQRGIEVDEFLQTTAPGIYAIGDVNGLCTLADSARAQARVAVENALGECAPFLRDETPRCVHTDPPVAAIGLLEQEARAADRPVTAASAKFRSASGTGAVLKLVADAASFRLLGAMIVGERAPEWIAQLSAEVRAHPNIADFAARTIPNENFATAIRAGVREMIGRQPQRGLTQPVPAG